MTNPIRPDKDFPGASMTPNELAELIDSIPEVAEAMRNRAALLDLLTLRPMGEPPEDELPVFVWFHASPMPSACVYRKMFWLDGASDRWLDTYALSAALGWTPIPTPLTEGDNHGA
jgi:hypothetical protein